VRDDMIPQSGRTTRNYHESTNPLALSSGKDAHYSGKFLIPKETEGYRLGNYGGQFPLSIVTHEVVVDTVHIPTYENLLKLQKQLETG